MQLTKKYSTSTPMRMYIAHVVIDGCASNSAVGYTSSPIATITHTVAMGPCR
jgi:hypothetical protein